MFNPKFLLASKINGEIIAEKKGASGVVYIVCHGENTYPRRVAYKTFQDEFHLDEEKKKQFIAECERWFLVKTPYLVTPFYPEILGGQPFICMPYCTTDLKTKMETHEFSRIEALVVITQLVKAMISLEDKNMGQHQDLNPPNIMLLDLCERFPDYPTNSMMNYEVKISDFGMLSLYDILGPSIGAIGGKFPFKAPEQYSKSQWLEITGNPKPRNGFNPDKFALGVIIYMLLTGTHPNGINNKKTLNRNTSGSAFWNWALSEPKISLPDDPFESIINECLNTSPNLRPELNNILKVCLKELESIDENVYDNIVLRFHEKDKMETYQPRVMNLKTQLDIAELPEKRREVLDSLIVELHRHKKENWESCDVIYYGRIVHAILLLMRKVDNLDNYILEELYALLTIFLSWHGRLNGEDLYPSKNAEGHIVLPKVESLRDFEVTSNFVSMAFRAIAKLEGEEKLKTYIDSLDIKLLNGLYYYFKAEQARVTWNFELVIMYLNMAKAELPDEVVFDEMRARWVDGFL